jgi:hypothetical protein
MMKFRFVTASRRLRSLSKSVLSWFRDESKLEGSARAMNVGYIARPEPLTWTSQKFEDHLSRPVTAEVGKNDPWWQKMTGQGKGHSPFGISGERSPREGKLTSCGSCNWPKMPDFSVSHRDTGRSTFVILGTSRQFLLETRCWLNCLVLERKPPADAEMRRDNLRESSDMISGKPLHDFTWAVKKGNQLRSSYQERIGWEWGMTEGQWPNWRTRFERKVAPGCWKLGNKVCLIHTRNGCGPWTNSGDFAGKTRKQRSRPPLFENIGTAFPKIRTKRGIRCQLMDGPGHPWQQYPHWDKVEITWFVYNCLKLLCGYNESDIAHNFVWTRRKSYHASTYRRRINSATLFCSPGHLIYLKLRMRI